MTPTNYLPASRLRSRRWQAGEFKRITNKIIQKLIQNRINTPADLAMAKRGIAKEYKISCPSNIELLRAYHNLVKNKRIKKSEKIENLLKTRPVRSLSGIVNVSVLTKPYPCPGKCIYCPQESGIPKSYVSEEPAVERAKKLKFDPYLQVKKRIEMLKAEGHPTDKIELRIAGGTWSFYPKKYQTWFIKECFRACNSNKYAYAFLLLSAQKKNEKAKYRIVGLSIETRPDFINFSEIKWLRELGVTMVELGVQSIYDDILKLNLRGHGVKEIILATRLLKNAGFKILYQMMPNLPGSDLKRDEKMFKELFQNPDFQPDYLKIYPCALLKEAPLYNWYLKGKYKPYSEKSLINLIKKIKKKIPYYVRIQRITRDIPSQKVLAGGAKISNLRQILANLSKKEGWKCECIRCREVKENYDPKEKVCLFREDYDASDGKEVFLSFENKNRSKIYSLLRLRIPVLALKENEKCSRFIFPALKDAAVIREVHTYGQLHPLNYTGSTAERSEAGDERSSATRAISPQHKGLGRKLIKESEKIAKEEFGLNKVAVISGVGARNYFRQSSYRLKDTYMIKEL